MESRVSAGFPFFSITILSAEQPLHAWCTPRGTKTVSQLVVQKYPFKEKIPFAPLSQHS